MLKKLNRNRFQLKSALSHGSNANHNQSSKYSSTDCTKGRKKGIVNPISVQNIKQLLVWTEEPSERAFEDIGEFFDCVVTLVLVAGILITEPASAIVVVTKALMTAVVDTDVVVVAELVFFGADVFGVIVFGLVTVP